MSGAAAALGGGTRAAAGSGARGWAGAGLGGREPGGGAPAGAVTAVRAGGRRRGAKSGG